MLSERFARIAVGLEITLDELVAIHGTAAQRRGWHHLLADLSDAVIDQRAWEVSTPITGNVVPFAPRQRPRPQPVPVPGTGGDAA